MGGVRLKHDNIEVVISVTLEKIPEKIGKEIQEAAANLLEAPVLMSRFLVNVFQTGSGTSSNMNANEVPAPINQGAMYTNFQALPDCCNSPT